MPKISIIVPVYNKQKFLSSSLDSILKQSYQDIEIIIINDGSTDNSGEIAREYSKIDNRIRVFDMHNRGIAASRNIGIDISEGEFIAFVDPGDIVEYDMYTKLISKVESLNIDLGICRIKEKNLSLNTEYYYPFYEIMDTPIYKEEINNRTIESILSREYYSYLISTNKLYRKKVIDENNISFSENMSQGKDMKFNIEIIRHVDSLIYVSESYYNYLIQEEELLPQKVLEHFYNEIVAHLKLGIDLCKVYERENLISLWEKEFVKDSIDQILRVWNSKLNKRRKYYIIKPILDDDIFKEKIRKFNGSNTYEKLFIKMCSMKSYTGLSILMYTIRRFNIGKGVGVNEIQKN